MDKSFIMVFFCLLLAAPAAPPEPKVKELISRELKDIPGKEGLMIEVEYPPGGADPIHRHNAHAFVYVLEGSIVMQVKGGDAVTLKAGESFTKDPMTCTSSVATRARRSRRNSLFSSSRRRAHRCFCRRNECASVPVKGLPNASRSVRQLRPVS